MVLWIVPGTSSLVYGSYSASTSCAGKLIVVISRVVSAVPEACKLLKSRKQAWWSLKNGFHDSWFYVSKLPVERRSNIVTHRKIRVNRNDSMFIVYFISVSFFAERVSHTN